MIVSVAELKAHLRVQQDDEDTYLENLLKQSQGAAEDFCNKSFDIPTPPPDPLPIIPEPVRLAVFLMASHFYEYRDSSDKQAYIAMRMAFEALLWPHRVITF